MNLNSTYQITLNNRKARPLTQFIEAETCDAAIRAARRTIQAHIHALHLTSDFQVSSMIQKVSEYTKLDGLYVFSFNGDGGAGHVTKAFDGVTLREAIADIESGYFVRGSRVYEIHNA